MTSVTIKRSNGTEESRSVDEVKQVVVNPKNQRAWVVLSDGSSGNVSLDDAAELATLGIDTKESGLVNWLNDKPLGRREKKGTSGS